MKKKKPGAPSSSVVIDSMLLKDEIRKRGFNQKKLAELTGISEKTISNSLTESWMSYKTLGLIAKEMNVNPERFIADNEKIQDDLPETYADFLKDKEFEPRLRLRISEVLKTLLYRMGYEKEIINSISEDEYEDLLFVITPQIRLMMEKYVLLHNLPEVLKNSDMSEDQIANIMDFINKI